MATVITLASWSSTGLRCPDHTISFCRDGSDDIHPISLIQMPNGTGKTTTLEMLRAALSGAASKWDTNKILSMRKQVPNTESGQFQVVILFDGRRLTITMDFDFEEGLVRYTTTLPSGNKEGFVPPSNLSKFFQPNFVNFFVFDGELANQLLNSSHTQAQSAIEALFQLQYFSQITDKIEEYWENKTANVSATEEKGLARRRNKVKNLRSRIETLKTKRTMLKKEHSTVTQELTKKEERFNEQLAEREETKDQLLNAEKGLDKAKVAVSANSKDLLDSMRNPHALSSVFAEKMISLKASLDRVKLPESAAKEFFAELADEAECICGREITDEIRSILLERSNRYLGSDDMALLNSMKSDIANLVGTDATDAQSHEDELSRKVQELQKITDEEGRLRTILDAIKNKAVASDPTLEKVDSEIKELKQSVNEIEDQLSRFESTVDNLPDKDTWGISVLEHGLKKAKDQLAEVTDTLAIKAKGDLIRKILDHAHQSSKRGISEDLCKEANGRIEQLMPYNRIRIREIKQSLILDGQEGGSVGETLSIGYAFLSTLFNRTEHRLPFVVDSPAGPIDLEVRANVAQLVPKLSNQFIAFVISAERPGFLPALRETVADNDIQYITIFRKDTPFDKTAEDGVEESDDGYMVSSYDFFNQFHIESEPANAV